MKFQLAAFADEADSRISEQIRAMKENNICYLEIRGVDGKNISEITNKKAKEIRKQLEDSGISVWSIGSPYGKIGICEEFEQHLEQFKYGLELAQILDAKHMRIFSFYIPSGKEEYYRDEVMRRLEQFLYVAKDSDIVLCHENEKEIYGDIAIRCEEIHKTFPKLKAVFDPANFIQCGQDIIQAWEKLVPYVEYMHIKDALADGLVVPAGRGIGQIPYLLKNYKGIVLTLEPHLYGFDGLEQLEIGEKTKMGYYYDSAREAFDVAVNELNELIRKDSYVKSC